LGDDKEEEQGGDHDQGGYQTKCHCYQTNQRILSQKSKTISFKKERNDIHSSRLDDQYSIQILSKNTTKIKTWRMGTTLDCLKFESHHLTLFSDL